MSKNLFWIDLEMTGLDDVRDSILEVAVVVTDLNFKPIEEFHRVVYQPQEVLDGMHDWCKKTHGQSGLTAAVPHGTPMGQVEDELVALANRHFKATEATDKLKVGQVGQIVLAGNSVGNDRRFIDRQMPQFAKLLHYRLIDVSSYKEIFRDKYNLAFEKKNAHRAVDDIYESIRELSFYLSYVKVPEHAASKNTPPKET